MPHRGEPLRCPSAQPGMGDVQILGVVSGSAEQPRLAYLNETVPATPDVLALAAPVSPISVFRFAARCEEKKCVHFDGMRCQLAARIVAMLPEVTDRLPPCIIRPTCRWHQQEGAAACLRCSQIVTLNPDADERLRQVAGGHAAPAPPMGG
jgi:hypothetical protein